MTKTIELKRLSIDLNNDWEQIVGKWNWVSFNLFKVYLEKENQFGMFEIELYILGFGIRLYWTYNQEMLNKKVEEYNKIIKEDKSVPLKEAMELLEDR